MRNWVSPPVPLIPRMVDKLLMECYDFVLIVPQWRSRPWFQALEEFVFPRVQLFMLVPPSNVVDGRFLHRERLQAVQCVDGGCSLRALTTFPNACVRCCVERHGSQRQSSSCQGSLQCGPRFGSSSQEPTSHGVGRRVWGRAACSAALGPALRARSRPHLMHEVLADACHLQRDSSSLHAFRSASAPAPVVRRRRDSRGLDQRVAMPFGLPVAPYLYTRVTAITEDFITTTA